MSSDKKKKHGKDHERDDAERYRSPSPEDAAAGASASSSTAQRPRYAEFKVLLRPDKLRRIFQAYDLWQHIRGAVEQAGVRFEPMPGEPSIRQRDIMFYDTPDYRLYENHFILRRRTHFRDGWSTAHDELTFKSGQSVHVRMRVKFTDFERLRGKVQVIEQGDELKDKSDPDKPTPPAQKPKP